MVRFNPHAGSKGSRARATTLVSEGENRLREAEILPEAAQRVTGQRGSRRMQLTQREDASGSGASGRGPRGHRPKVPILKMRRQVLRGEEMDPRDG